MLPGLIAAPFSILSAALPNTNLTEIARTFNETNVRSILSPFEVLIPICFVDNVRRKFLF